MTEPQSTEVPKFIKGTLSAFALAIGAVYVLGPPAWSSSSSLIFVKALMDIKLWGSIFMISGMLMISTRLIGYGVAMATWLAWWLLVAEAAATGQLNGGGALVWPLLYLALMAHEVYSWGKSRVSVSERVDGH